MEALPLFTALFAAILIAPGSLRALAAGPLARANYRGRQLACPLGLVVVAAALLSLIPLSIAAQLAHGVLLRPELGWVALYVVGVALLGLADDALANAARGWRGHLTAALHGRFGTGTLKALGSAGLALYVSLGHGGTGHFLLAAAVLVLATNAFNLLDLRPGRAVKAFVLLGAGLTLGAADLQPLWVVGLFVGPVLVVGCYDLREEGLLGDSGSNAIGALAGAWLVLTLSDAGLAIALVLLAAITLYGEYRSISEFIERTPGLRELDSIGRTTDAADAQSP